MSRAHWLPGLFFIIAALVLSILVSVSLPFLTAMDITRVHFETATSGGNLNASSINQIRFGIWSYCTDSAVDGSRTCSAKGHGYSVQVEAPNNGGVVTIGSSWTRGLAIHPVATIVAFLALVCAFSQHITVSLFASVLAFLAAFLTLLAFACDIALLAFVRHEMSDHLAGVHAKTITGPGFWLTFVSLILLLISGCTVCFARRRSRMANADSYPMSSTKRSFWTRFRR